MLEFAKILKLATNNPSTSISHFKILSVESMLHWSIFCEKKSNLPSLSLPPNFYQRLPIFQYFIETIDTLRVVSFRILNWSFSFVFIEGQSLANFEMNSNGISAEGK